MSDTSASGNVKDLNASRKEALQGLLHSLGHATSGPSSGTTSSTEPLQTLAKKIEEILGHGENRGKTPENQPNRLLNEDGLPIVDISEPVDEDFQSNTSSLPVLEQDLIPFSRLPLDERERRRRERDRILDLLEEEERHEERDAAAEQKEATRKRKESVKAELDRLKAARGLQKKMGQALVRHAKGTAVNGQDEDTRPKPQTTSSAAKKSVSFADVRPVEADERLQETSVHRPEWGDVTPGRLRAQSRVPLVDAAGAQKYPMKMRVVERRPAAAPTSFFRNGVDSDDESSSSAGRLSPRMESDSSNEEDRSSSSHDGPSDDELLAEGLDYDIAQHHREIALEYHAKKHAISAETTKAMSALALDDYDEQDTSSRQLPLSRFRADRMAAAYDRSHSPVSTSIGESVVPASRQKTLRNSVRVGKLENGQLVGGGSGESGSEDEAVRGVIQMLQAGDIRNVGPDFKPSSATAIASPQNSDTVGPPSARASTTARGTKPSRFKVARGGGTAETATFSQGYNTRDNARSQPAIASVVERKISRSFTSQQFPINKPSLRPPSQISELIPPMIIDSPSFPARTE